MQTQLLPRSLPVGLLATAGITGAMAYMVIVQFSFAHVSYDTWAALVVAPVLVVLTVPLLRAASREEDGAFLARVLLLALLLKFAASAVRYFVAFDIYGGSADAAGYVGRGIVIAASIRDGSFVTDVAREVPGTGFIDILTGVVYAFTGPTRLGGFLVFGWFAFLGQYLFVRAFREAMPDGHHRAHALAIMLLPSLLYWPSSIGKEAWLLLGLGMASLGLARILVRRRGGLLPALAGLAGIGVVRPHIAAFVVLAGTVAFVRRSRAGRGPLRPLRTVVGLAVLGVAAILVVRITTDFFGLDSYSVTEATSVLENTAEQTNRGGSSFSPTPVRSIADLPAGLLTVLFRPLPLEAHNVQALIASIEGTVLLGGFLIWLWRAPRFVVALWQRPWVTFVTAYTVLFVIAFSYFSNFGLLTRQRVQVLPFLIMLLCARLGERRAAEERIPPADASGRLPPRPPNAIPDAWPQVVGGDR